MRAGERGASLDAARGRRVRRGRAQECPERNLPQAGREFSEPIWRAAVVFG